MKLSMFSPFGLKTAIHAPKIEVFGGFHPRKWGAMSTKPTKGTSSGRNGSSGVLIMSLSVIVLEKSRGNKKSVTKKKKKKKKKKNDTFLASLASL